LDDSYDQALMILEEVEDGYVTGPSTKIEDLIQVGQGASFVQEERPSDPVIDGVRWYKPSEATTYVWYTDDDSGQWVEENPSVVDAPNRIIPFATVAEATADTSLAEGNTIQIAERANGIFNVISGTGTANTFNIIAHDSLSLSFVLRVGDRPNVLEFGATGDGATDDYAAIQATLNYASSNQRRTVYLPAGSYVTSQKLINTDINATAGSSACGIVGDGPFSTRLKPSGDFTVLNLLSSYVTCGGFSIEWALTAIGSIPSTRIGVEFGSGTNQTSQCKFQDILVMYAYRSFYLKDWVAFPGFGTMYIVDFERLVSFRAANYGFYLDSVDNGSTTLRFASCWANCSDSTGTYGGEGFFIDGVNDVLMENVAIDFCNSRAIWLNTGMSVNLVGIALESCFSNVLNAPLIQIDATAATITGVKEIACTVDVGGGNVAYGIYAMPDTTINVSGYSRVNLTTTSGTLYKVGLNNASSRINVSDSSVQFAEALDNGWFSMMSFGGIRYSSTGNPPTQGVNQRGEYVRSQTQTVGSPKGWYCTVAGTPGTWVSEGNL